MNLEPAYRAAVALQRRGAYAEAVAAWREILAAAPGLARAEANLALALLGAGDYAEGFPKYDIRFTRQLGRVEKPNLSFPEWRGEPLAGKSILVWMEQGFGDQIMFARFVRQLADQAAEVTVLTPPALVRLFAPLPARIIPAVGDTEIRRHDFWIMPGSMPGRLGTTLETLPAAPYLPGKAGGAGFGLVWTGDSRHLTNADRSLPDDLAAELLALPGARSLHPQDTGARDFQDTAEIVKDLALVISVCTAPAHLAGAMGKPVWVLLMAENCDWRWMGGREDSPWYPSARLFRQPEPGDWRSVVDRVKAELAAQRIGGA